MAARFQKDARQRRREHRADRPPALMDIRISDGPRTPPLYPRFAYDEACLLAPEMSQVVCEGCGLAQPYVAADWDGVLPKVLLCAGPFGLGCGSESCVTIEAYADVHS